MTDWAQGGDSVGAVGVLGTLDDYPVHLISDGDLQLVLNRGGIGVKSTPDTSEGVSFDVTTGNLRIPSSFGILGRMFNSPNSAQLIALDDHDVLQVGQGTPSTVLWGDFGNVKALELLPAQANFAGDVKVGTGSVQSGTTTLYLRPSTNAGTVVLDTGRLYVAPSIASNWAAQVRNTNATAGYGLLVTPGDDTVVAFGITEKTQTTTRDAFYGNGNVALCIGAGTVTIGTSTPGNGLLELRQRGWSPGDGLRINSNFVAWDAYVGNTGDNSLYIQYNNTANYLNIAANGALTMVGSGGFTMCGPAYMPNNSYLHWKDVGGSYQPMLELANNNYFYHSILNNYGIIFNNLTSGEVARMSSKGYLSLGYSGGTGYPLQISTNPGSNNWTAWFQNTDTNYAYGLMVGVGTAGAGGTILGAYTAAIGNVGSLTHNGTNLILNNATVTAPSDRRLKTNILDTERGLDTLRQVRVVDFDWSDGRPGRHVGVIAQELHGVPELAHLAMPPNRDRPNWTYDALEMIPFTLKCVQEVDKDIDSVRTELSDALTRLAQLEQRLSLLGKA